MAKERYVVEIIPHECYFGLPCEPEITATVDKITVTNRRGLIPRGLVLS